MYPPDLMAEIAYQFVMELIRDGIIDQVMIDRVRLRIEDEITLARNPETRERYEAMLRVLTVLPFEAGMPADGGNLPT